MIFPYGDLERLTLPVMMKSFQPYLDANRNTKKPVFHVSLNPHPHDKLTDTDYNLIAHDYMKEMGYGEQPYIVYKHTDIERTHIHIVSVRVGLEGRKLPHRFEAKKSMDILRGLEKKYGLTPAIKGVRSQIPLTPEPVEYKQSDIRQRIDHNVRVLLNEFKTTDFPTFNALLRQQNIEAEIVRGKVKNRKYKGLLYRILDADGRQVGKTIKASAIGKDVGFNAIKKSFQRSKDMLTPESENGGRIRETFDQAIDNNMSLDGFKHSLKSKGIIFFNLQLQPGKKVVRFFDEKTMLFFRGNDLGEQYQINNIREMLQQNEARQMERQEAKQEQNPYYNHKKGRGIL